jgi:PucR C-terminal helix-turn-helix domain/GGDEF-like domain
MKAQPSTDPDEHVRRITSELASNVDELARDVASAVRAEVDFYKTTRAVADDELLASCTENLRYALKSLEDGVAFDTSPSVTTGSRRAAAGVPLPAVMHAYRIASYRLWDAVVDIATEKRGVSRDMMIEATRRIWRFQNLYTDAMATAYREQNIHQVLEDEAERAALAEALLDGRTITDYSVWEVAQLLRLPLSGPYVVIAAECPTLGKQALPGISGKLRCVDIFSAWRLLPDIQVGIAQVPSSSKRDTMLELIERQAIKRVGVSPEFHELTDTAQALRYARVAMNARCTKNGGVTVFENSVLAVAAVSAPEVTKKVATVILGKFDDLPSEEKDVLLDTFRAWLANKGSVAHAAAQLYVHPNTVRHRLHRVERHTGRSLAVPDELAEMCLAFEVRENMPNRPTATPNDSGVS